MVALVDSHYDGKWNDLSLRSPFDRPTPFVYTGYGYVYPCVFIAAPEYWDRTTRMLPPTQLRGTKVSDVLYPDLKALLVDDSSRYVAWNENSKQGVVTAQVDGRATATRLSGILPGYQDADGFNLPPYLEAHAGGGISDLLHTQQGVRGRDIAR
jgi:hypothetical protein